MKPSSYLLTYYAILIAVGLMSGALGPALPSLAAQTGQTLKGVSLVLALRPLGYLLGVFLSGPALDRFKGHPLMAWAVLGASLSFALIPFMPLLWALCSVVMLLGFADGVMDVGSNTLLPWIYGEKSGPYFNGLHFCFGLGALAAPLIVGLSLSRASSVGPAFWAMALLLLPLAPLLLRLPSPSHPPKPQDTKAAPVALGLAALVALVFLGYGGAEAGFGNWVYSYALKKGLADELAAARLTSLFWAALSLGRLAGVWLAHVAPLGAILAADSLGCLLSLGLILLWPESQSALWAGSFGAGLFMASFFPTLVAWAGKRLAPGGRVSGRLTSLFFVCSSSGVILLPWAIGLGFESRGPAFSMQMILGSLILMTLALTPLLLAKK